ncbi:MAG: alpha-glucan family phosphorylase, partial [Chthonomonas sp.]|nr:alpha-glucan family phosphorylase [Chthonomonas sp.]
EAQGTKFEDFLRLGKFDPNNPNEDFNMAVLAMENANFVNGVSKLHAEVSRGMFSGRWPEYSRDEVPIEAITNGIHTQTWIGNRMCELLDRHVGPDWRNKASEREIWDAAAENIPDAELWEMRENQRGDFIRYCRKRLMRTMATRNASRHEISNVSNALDPRVLTIGFARRFATYKRASLLLTDRDRLKSILFHEERPVQFVFAGKSHPRDDGGKRLIQDLFNFIHHEGGAARMLFLEDYDMEVARHLVQGVDVWLNNPRRPMEASGTSGMKVLPNGGLNCSILDGWWAEGYEPGTGWAIGDAIDRSDHVHQDWLDSRALYQLIEQEISPLFYARGENGLPTGWLDMMRKSMRELSPEFSTWRMVQDYTSRFYMPSHDAYLRLQENGLARAKDALAWRSRIQENWKDVGVCKVSDTSSLRNALGSSFTISIEVSLGGLAPKDVEVQVLVGQVGSNRELHHFETIIATLVESTPGGCHRFEASVSNNATGHRGYVCRVVPHHEDVHVQSELALVAWQDR